MPGPIDLLIATAEPRHAVLTSRSGVEAHFRVAPPTSSGAPAPAFNIMIRERGTEASAREGAPARLPRFCPERHINHDGSFCLYSEEDDPHPITTPDQAEVWWGKLFLFLRIQLSATALRRWPGKADARAHGAAARHQATAEKHAASLGPRFASLLRADRFATESVSRGKEGRIRLTLDGRFVGAVKREPLKLMTLRGRCRCAEGRLPICSCEDHAHILAEFILSLEAWKEAEENFTKSLKKQGYTCCGTLSECPLAA